MSSEIIVALISPGNAGRYLSIVKNDQLSLTAAWKQVAVCNAYKPDLVVDIHFNAGGGMVIYYNYTG